MGNTYTVSRWVYKEYPLKKGYEYEQIYSGESFTDAISAMKDAKNNGEACVKLEWR